MKKLMTVLPVALALLVVSGTAFAQDGDPNFGSSMQIGFAVVGGAIGQGLTAKAMLESVSRNPQAASKLNAPFYVGLAFIESLALFALAVAFVVP
ncbi:MAG: ATP synthase F0 subunit C [Myxococcota bacterium]